MLEITSEILNPLGGFNPRVRCSLSLMIWILQVR